EDDDPKEEDGSSRTAATCSSAARTAPLKTDESGCAPAGSSRAADEGAAACPFASDGEKGGSVACSSGGVAAEPARPAAHARSPIAGPVAAPPSSRGGSADASVSDGRRPPGACSVSARGRRCARRSAREDAYPARCKEASTSASRADLCC